MPNFNWYNNYPETARPLTSSWNFVPQINIGMPLKVFPSPAKMSNHTVIGGYVGSKCQRNDEKPDILHLGSLISPMLESLGKNKLCNSSSQANNLMRNLIPNLIQTTIGNIKFDLPVKEITKVCKEFNFECPKKKETTFENICKDSSFGMPVTEHKTSEMLGQELKSENPVQSTSSAAFWFEIPFCDNPKTKQKSCFGFKMGRLSESSVESCDSDFIVFDEHNDEEDTCNEDNDIDDETDSDDENDIYFSWALQVAAEDSMKLKSCDVRPIKKVRFKSEPEVRVMRVWDFASRAARIGTWEIESRDRNRFEKRIASFEPTISPILTPKHRAKIWQSLQDHR